MCGEYISSETCRVFDRDVRKLRPICGLASHVCFSGRKFASCYGAGMETVTYEATEMIGVSNASFRRNTSASTAVMNMAETSECR